MESDLLMTRYYDNFDKFLARWESTWVDGPEENPVEEIEEDDEEVV